MAQLFNLARMTVSSSGTGNITLNAAVTGFLTFDLAGCSTASTGNVITYGINDTSQSEVGIGTYYSSGTKIVRGSSTNYLFSTNSNSPINMSNAAQVYIAPSASDLSKQLQATYLTAASTTYTTPVNSTLLTYYRITAQGAGGGGGGVLSISGSGGGGGGGGGWLQAYFNGLGPGQVLTVAVGSAGISGTSTGSNGGTGGTTTVTSTNGLSLTAVGGTGGTGTAATDTYCAGGAGGAASGGTVNLSGGQGQHSNGSATGFGGTGAPSPFGGWGAGAQANVNGNGMGATGYGSGGGGAFQTAGGGAGGVGVVIIEVVI